MTQCKDCKHFTPSSAEWIGQCAIMLPPWVESDTTRTVRADGRCDLGEQNDDTL